MEDVTITCDACGKKIDNVYRYLRVSVDYLGYFGDDGSERICRHYDLCPSCKDKFWKFMDKFCKGEVK